jgi:hypothetical protein
MVDGFEIVRQAALWSLRTFISSINIYVHHPLISTSICLPAGPDAEEIHKTLLHLRIIICKFHVNVFIVLFLPNKDLA